MRDLQHWKDKVELSLDGRQVFFLFFGGAVIACMLFALGIMTGRRLEARAIALETPSAEDPLAALDQLGDLEDEELTYHRALTKDSRGATRSKDPAAAMSDPESSHAKPALKPTPVTPPKAGPAKPGAVVPGRPTSASLTEPTDDADAPVAARPAAVAAKPALSAPVVAKSASVAPKPAPVAPAAAKPASGTPVAGKPVLAQNPLKGEAKESAVDPAQAHFTLQLSAFAARHDADDFMHRVQAAGYRAFVVSSDLPGKGVMYRVRVGDYATKDAAMAEKGAVEKKLKVSAYLAKL